MRSIRSPLAMIAVRRGGDPLIVAAAKQEMGRHDHGRQRVAQVVGENAGEQLVVPNGARELVSGADLIGDIGRDDEHAVDVPQHVAQGGIHEVEVGFSACFGWSDLAFDLLAHAGLTGRQNTIEEVLEHLRLELGQHPEQRPPDDLLMTARPHLATRWVGQLDDVLRTPQDANGDGGLHEQ